MIERKDMNIRKSVGAFIQTNEGNFIIVKNVGHGEDFWDVMKGGVEEGENLEQALIREVKEELGIDVSDIVELNQEFTFEMPEPTFRKTGFTHQNVKLFSVRFKGDVNDITIDKSELSEFRIVNKKEYEELLKYDVVKQHFMKFLGNIKLKPI